MCPAETARKKVAVFSASERVRQLVGELFGQMGLEVESHASVDALAQRLAAGGLDLLLLDLDMLADDYQDMVAALEELDLAAAGRPPLLGLSRRRLSVESRNHLARLGVGVVLSTRAPWPELMFSANRLLFPKLRELRNYSRVFGGFPVQYLYRDSWHQGQVYNIGQQGAFVHCPQPPPENERLRVRFVLPGVQAELQVAAVVNWVNTPEAGLEALAPPGMGVRFEMLAPDQQQTLEAFIEQEVSRNGS